MKSKFRPWGTAAVSAVLAAAVAGCAYASPNAEPPSTASEGAAPWWHPEAADTWQVQLSQGLDPTVPAQIYEADGVDTPAAALQQVKDRGGRLVCYINGGAWEEWRADADEFPEELLGNGLDGWPGERWLDIRRTEELLPIMSARMDVCAERGFDAVDADNVDGYENDSGFPLSEADQLFYIRELAQMAHSKGLGFGLKNAVGLVGDLPGAVDFAVNEQCHEYDECSAYDELLAEGKPVVVIEYGGDPVKICRDLPAGMHVLFKDPNLGPGVLRCAE